MPNDTDPYLAPLPDPNRDALANPRVKSFLDKISKSEGADYNTLVGGRKINDLSRHPNVVGLRTSAGPSTAFGRYQITGTTNKSKLAKYAHLDYSPENQDLRAVELLRQTGALDALEKDDEPTAMKRAGKEWASIPGSTLPGRKNHAAFGQSQQQSDPYLAPLPTSMKTETDDPYLAPLNTSPVQTKKQRPTQPPITDALDKLIADVTKRTAAIQPPSKGMARTAVTGVPAPARMKDAAESPSAVKQDSSIGALRQRDEQEIARRGRIGSQMSREQAAMNRTGLPGLPAYDMGSMSRVEREAAITSRSAVERQQEEEQARQAERYKKDKPEIDRLAKHYQQAIKSTGALPESGQSKWTTETLAKGVAPLVEKFAGFGRILEAGGSPGAGAGADILRIHAQALRQAAEAEGADRNEASKFVQNVTSGFIGSAPELAAMSVGVPAPVVFGAGSGLEAAGARRPVVPAIAQGVGTGLAFETPGVGQGVTRAITKGIGTGAATTGIDLAAGATPKEAITSGVTNALMRGVPEAMASRRFQHVDFGEIEVLSDQSGAKSGRLKVAEVSDPEKIHYVKKSDMQGRGNARMIPIKEPPSEPAVKPTASPEAVRPEVERSASTSNPMDVAVQQRQRLADLESQLAEWQQVRGNSRRRDSRIRSLQGQIAEARKPLEDAARQAQVNENEQVESTRYSSTPRFDEWAENESGQRLSQLEPSELSALSERYKQEFASQPEPPALREFPPLAESESRAAPAPVKVKPAEKIAPKLEVAEKVEVKPLTPAKEELRLDEPDFVRAARERKAAREAEKTKGIEYRRAGADPYELIDDIIVRGHELYSQKINPTFQEWSQKIKEEFGSKADDHVRGVWAKLGGKDVLPESASTKNDATAELRRDLDLLEIERPEKKSWETSINNAVEKGLDKKAEEIADKIIAGNREVGLDNEQAAGIQIKMRELENKWEELYSENPNNPELSSIKDRLDKLTQATDMGGTAPARDLAFRRSMIDKEFRLIKLIRDAEKAKGRKVTPEEVARYDAIVKERDQALKDRDAALEKLNTKRVQQDLEKSSRQRKRTETKEVLDQEAVVIRADIMAEITRLKNQASQGKFLSQGGLGALDPDGVIAKGVLKYVRNRAKVGGLKAEALIDEVHGIVKDLGASRRQVAELLAGGTQREAQRADWVKELAKVRSEIDAINKAEDVAAGRRSPRQEGPRLTEAPKQGPKLSEAPRLGPPNVVKRSATRLKQLEAREAELTRKTEAKEFDPKAKPAPFPYDRGVKMAEDRVAIAEAKFKKEMNRAKGGHQLRNASGVLKAWLLSGPSTQIKNTLGTLGWQGFEEQSRVFASAMDSAISAGRQVLGKDAQRGIMGVSPTAIIDSLKHMITVGGRQAVDIMKRGATQEQMERHQYNEIDFGVNTGNKKVDNAVKTIELAHNVIFRFMSASDRLFYQFAHQRNLIDRATVAAKNEGLKGEELKRRIEELKLDKKIDADAKHDALVSTFNNDNALSTRIKRARSKVVNPRSTLSPRAADRINAAENLALDFILPFDRTPTNVISRIVEASPAGHLKNAGQLAKAAMSKGMDAEAQRNFSRTFGRASAGTANIALGIYLADKLIDVDDKGEAYLNLGFTKINLNTVSPLGNLLALGARLKKAYDDPKLGVGKYIKPVLREPANLPVLRATNTLSELVRDPERSAAKTGARFAGMAIPFGGLARDIARVTDSGETETGRRGPKGFADQIKMGIPGLRQQVPIDSENERTLLRHQLQARSRKGEAITGEVVRLIKEGKLRPSDMADILSDARETPLQLHFKRFGIEGALDDFERRSPEEKKQLRAILSRKGVLISTLPSAQQPALRKRYLAAVNAQ